MAKVFPHASLDGGRAGGGRLGKLLGGRSGRDVFSAVRVLAALVGTFSVLCALLYSGYVGYTELRPESVDVPDRTLAADETGRKVSYGRSFLARRGRLWQLHLEGSPAEMGAAHGRLAGRLYRNIDERVVELLSSRYRSMIERWAESMLLRWDYRGSDAALSGAGRRELAALAATLPQAERGGLPTYHRVFLHQCLFELTQRLQDVIISGHMFAVAPRQGVSGSEAGNLIIGRTLTVDLGQGFEAERVVTFYYPDGKYPFVSIGWAGLTGVVTGVNARGVFVAANPARTDDPREDGARPLPIVLREVLETADTLEQAVSILEEADLRTAGVVLIGDGVQRKAVVLEAGPRAREGNRTTRGEDENVVWATDHLVREPFETDAQNDRIMRSTSSGYRYERLADLLGQVGNFGPDEAVRVLRDRRGRDNVELGLGNPNALENLRTTHSVVVDVTSMVMWVAEGPSTLGRYRAFDLRHLLARQGTRPAPLDDLPADRLLHSEEFNDYNEALRQLEYAHYLMEIRRQREALAAALVALALAPDVPALHRTLGDIERSLGSDENAVGHYERYLELSCADAESSTGYGKCWGRDPELVRGIIAELSG